VPSLLSGDLRESWLHGLGCLSFATIPAGAWDHLPNALIVSLRHGFGKNYFRTSMRWYDFVCVNSVGTDRYLREDTSTPGFAHRIRAHGPGSGLRAPAGCGAPPAQRFVRPDLEPRVDCGRRGPAGGSRRRSRRSPSLRFASSYPYTRHVGREMLEAWKALARREPRVELVENLDADIYRLLPDTGANTDCSSTAFFALDRPIVLVNNPMRLQGPTI
jgi:hypothetical protein